MVRVEIGDGGITVYDRVTWTENPAKLNELRVTGASMWCAETVVTRVRGHTVSIAPLMRVSQPRRPRKKAQ